jgi:NADPH2:quinone reductase
MRAIALTAPDKAPAPIDLPAPAPAEEQVLVRVHASSVNPVDNAIAAGMLLGMGVEHEFPVTLGRDYTGIVKQVGANVTRYTPGDRVYGFILHANPAVHDGSWAELVTVPEHISIGPAPDGVDLATAGAAPLAGITAVTAIDALELSVSDVLLVVGATGGIGSLAAQLAARAGITVIAPSLPEDEEYLRDLGVRETVQRDGEIAAHQRDGLTHP